MTMGAFIASSLASVAVVVARCAILACTGSRLFTELLFMLFFATVTSLAGGAMVVVLLPGVERWRMGGL